jgi:hypothetical protein
MTSKVISLEQAKAALWLRGELSWKLRDYQLPLYDQLKKFLANPKGLKFVMNVARRFGKSHINVLIALEYGLQKPNSLIRFACPTQKALKKIILPILNDILSDCPESVKPRWLVQEGVLRFHNGSELHLAGADSGNAERLRGQKSDLNVVDEAGFVDDLDYLVRSILVPQTMTTGGKTILISTPPSSPAHAFVEMAIEAESDGFYIKKTLYDNKSLTKDLIDLYAKEAGGYESSTFKREYLCEFVTDEALQIIPEWDDKFVQDSNKPRFFEYYHGYTALDLGFKDKTALIFGYYDFEKAALIIEDEAEILGQQVTSQKIAEVTKEKEKLLLGTRLPYRRISDNSDPIVLNDMGTNHDVHFMATGKDSLEAMLNKVRTFVQQGRLIINPRCEMLIGCLKYGVFVSKENRTFARSSVYGHYDHLAALVYLIRNLDEVTNPVPKAAVAPIDSWFNPEPDEDAQIAQSIKQIFGLKKKASY